MFQRFAARALAVLFAFAGSVACAAPVTDLNGDAKSDLVWFNPLTGQTSVWLMNGAAQVGQSFILTDPNWRVLQTADFNGDGKADLLWYNAAAGQTVIWLMNGTVPIGSAFLLSDPNWKVVFVADFNGDGKSDLLWHNWRSGQTVVWLMNGTVVSVSALLVADLQWQPVGTPDLDGDGKADLLWRNATTGQTVAWLMNGASQKFSASLLTDPSWRVTNTPDLNGDGKSDLLWYNESTGQTVAWLMNGLTQVSSAVLLSDPNWKVTATPDLNGDGKADLLWYSAAFGQTSAWLMNGTARLSGNLLLSDFSWTVVATPDLNGDGKADLLWFNAAEGRTSTWLMNGTSVVSGPVLLTDPNWRQATQPDTDGYTVRALNYTNSANYTLRTFASSGVVDAAGVLTFYDQRVGLASGVAIPTANLYDTAVFATPTGWQTFSASVPNTSSAGNPSHSSFGLGYEYTTTRVDRDVSGQSLASVVAQAQNTGGNSTSTLVGVNAGSLSGTLPPGSRTRTVVNVPTATPVSYRTSDGFVGLGVTTLASMVATFPVPSSPTGANTVSMGNLHDSPPCGTTVCVQERVRVAFGPGNATTYYLCDLNQSTNQSFNCGNIGTGTYAQNTAVDGVTPIMNFANLPAATAVKNEVRVFVQRNGVVYFGWQDKLSTTSQTRLNDVAFRALAPQLGIAAP